MQRTQATTLVAVSGLGLVLALAAPPAVAQTKESQIGIGFQGLAGGNFSGVADLTLLPGLQGVFDKGPWHIDGTIGFFSGNNTTLFQVGSAFWLHLHQSASSDFSLGGGFGVASFSTDGLGGDYTRALVNVGAQIRAFVVTNVALNATGGIVFATGGENLDEAFAIGGQPMAAFGMTYYFR